MDSKSLPSINLGLLKDLVSALEKSTNHSEKIKEDDSFTHSDFVIEMSKVAGLLSGIIQESTMLILDAQQVVKLSQQPPAPKSGELLDKLLGSFPKSVKNNKGNWKKLI